MGVGWIEDKITLGMSPWHSKVLGKAWGKHLDL